MSKGLYLRYFKRHWLLEDYYGSRNKKVKRAHRSASKNDFIKDERKQEEYDN